MKEKDIDSKDIRLGHSPYVRATYSSPIVRVLNKISRNTWCPLSSKKFKHCCGKSGQDFCNEAKQNLEKYLNDLKNPENDKQG